MPGTHTEQGLLLQYTRNPYLCSKGKTYSASMKLKKCIAHKQKHQHPGWKNQKTGKHKPDLAIVCKMSISGSKPQNSSDGYRKL